MHAVRCLAVSTWLVLTTGVGYDLRGVAKVADGSLAHGSVKDMVAVRSKNPIRLFHPCSLHLLRKSLLPMVNDMVLPRTQESIAGSRMENRQTYTSVIARRITAEKCIRFRQNLATKNLSLDMRKHGAILP